MSIRPIHSYDKLTCANQIAAYNQKYMQAGAEWTDRKDKIEQAITSWRNHPSTESSANIEKLHYQASIADMKKKHIQGNSERFIQRLLQHYTNRLNGTFPDLVDNFPTAREARLFVSQDNFFARLDNEVLMSSQPKQNVEPAKPSVIRSKQPLRPLRPLRPLPTVAEGEENLVSNETFIVPKDSIVSPRKRTAANVLLILGAPTTEQRPKRKRLSELKLSKRSQKSLS